ncbi:hypothetical protein OC834_006641 [Tilletia horrida]|nr:hypothetical protein OC834_006641 [Tilletia horrida]
MQFALLLLFTVSAGVAALPVTKVPTAEATLSKRELQITARVRDKAVGTDTTSPVARFVFDPALENPWSTGGPFYPSVQIPTYLPAPR